MNHSAAEWEKSRGVGGREDGRPDLADDSVNGVITTIPLSPQYKQEVTDEAALTFAVSSSSSPHSSPPSVCQFACLFFFLSFFFFLLRLGRIAGSGCVDESGGCLCECVCESLCKGGVQL